MERDFLGIHGNDSKEENRGRRQDSAFLGSSPLQWPFSNNLTSMQQFMSFKRPHEDGAKIVQFNKRHSGFQLVSTVDAFEATSTRRPSPVLAQQKSFTLERQGVHLAMQSQGRDSLDAAKLTNDVRTFPAVSAHSFPMTTSSPLFQVHGAPSIPNLAVSTLKQQLYGGATPTSVHSLGPNMGSYSPRNVANSLPMTSQLTIFYAGSVNVYDDIPLDKAQAIMFLASAGSRSISNVLDQRPETPLLDSNKGSGPDNVGTNENQMRTPTPQVTPSCSGLSSPISVTSQNAIHSASNSVSTTADMMASKALETAPSNNNQNEPLKTVSAPLASPSSATELARAVPQARKASLARFLEKRKERVTNAMPYSCTKNSPEEVVIPENVNFHNKPTLPDPALSSNMKHTWQLGRSKSSIVESGESPTTRLEI